MNLEELEKHAPKRTMERVIEAANNEDDARLFEWLPETLRTGGRLSLEAIALLVERANGRKDAHLGAVRD